jgi:hypothetical protein
VNPGGVKAVAIAGNRRPDFIGDFDGSDAVCKALVAPLVLIAAGINGKVFKLFAQVFVAHSGLEVGAHGTGLEFNSVLGVHGSGLALFFSTVFTLDRFWGGVTIAPHRELAFRQVSAHSDSREHTVFLLPAEHQPEAA